MRERFIEYSMERQKTERDSLTKLSLVTPIAGSNQERIRILGEYNKLKLKPETA